MFNLQKLLQASGLLEFVFFWKTVPVPGPGYFSQWYLSPFVVDGVRYASAEQYMMAEKARLFGDTEVVKRILQSASPKDVKALGRQVRNFRSDVWEARAFDIVVAGNLAKFSQNDEMKRYILSTGDKVVVEASPLDRIWGIGLAEDDPRALHPSQWQGENRLGFALMEVRDRLGQESRNTA